MIYKLPDAHSHATYPLLVTITLSPDAAPLTGQFTIVNTPGPRSGGSALHVAKISLLTPDISSAVTASVPIFAPVTALPAMSAVPT